jgi:dienelactone hydrolase
MFVTLIPIHQIDADDGRPVIDNPALTELQSWLDTPIAERAAFDALTHLDTPLSAADAEAAADLLWNDQLERWRTDREDEGNDKTLVYDGFTMPFTVEEFGDRPEAGWSIYISLHGGGGAPKEVNDQQWQNQQQLYQLEEGLYVVPRAPTNEWNLWHQDHIDVLFERLIQDLVAFHDANADRVYLMGYSAGGDGVYQVAPRMADRFSAASMMAGHPNEATPLGLRNLPFAIHVGALDDGYGRNAVARDWGARLDELHAADPDGYTHVCELHAGKGHWMDLEDAVAIEWMSDFTRDPAPQRIVWRQDDVVHASFYWLGVDPENAEAGDEMVAEIDGQTISVQSENVEAFTVLLNDDLVNLDEPVIVRFNDEEVTTQTFPRTLRSLHATLLDRGDRRLMYAASCNVPAP